MGLKLSEKGISWINSLLQMQKSVNFWDFWDDLEMGLAIFGCGGIEIIGFGLFCGFVMLKYMGGFAVVQGGKVSAP